ncbi:hypothetical protein, partial [Thiocystis violacea]|uniref:hypothetical protein n=1 Tax=Thiocystis violacea TaxID=13725 RepID=UPI001904E85E
MTTSQKRRGPKPTGTAMTSAERQRRYIERLKAGAKADNPVTNADDEAASDSVRIAKGELERLRAECLSSAGTISRLSKDRDILTGQLRKLDGAADTIERLRADLAARDVEIQRLKTEVAQAQEKAAAARARESGYREQ